MHIALGVRSTIFPIDRFLNARGRTSVTIATAAQLGNHEPATLTFSSNPSRRGGEWLIRDQYSHRHPAWSSAAGFPSRYDKTDPPYVLIFRVDTTFHVRFARASKLSKLPRRSIPTGILARDKGIAPASEASLGHWTFRRKLSCRRLRRRPHCKRRRSSTHAVFLMAANACSSQSCGGRVSKTFVASCLRPIIDNAR